jgi:putative phage-type endonuclease
METKFEIDRNSGIGGSDVATILGFNKYKTREELFLEKTGRGVEFKGNKYTELGNKYEGSIAEHWFKKNTSSTGFLKKPDSFRSPKYPHLVANADFLHVSELAGTSILEIKTSQLKNKDRWEVNGNFQDVYWYPYYWQILHYIIVFDCSLGHLYCQFFEDDKPTDIFYEAIINVRKNGVEYISTNEKGSLKPTGNDIEFLITETKKFWDEVIKWREQNVS